MPLTISQALTEIPALNSARVVAGWQGLNQVIRWTHIIDHPDVIPWVREGYLLLTTAFSLMLNPDSQLELIPKLAEKKLAGMMVNVGRYMGEIPPAMVEAAQRYNFPLIALPWEVNFTEVTHAIHERIINEQYSLAEQVDHIHKVLTQIVIDGGGLDLLASQLAGLIGRSITIEDDSLSLLAYHSIPSIDNDNVRQRSIAEGRTPENLITYQTRQGLYELLRRDPRPHKIDPISEMGLTMERVVAPIMVGQHLLGYIWVIASEHPLAELDFQAIERGANIAALILSREQAIFEAEQRVKASLLDTLIDPQSARDIFDLPETLKKLGLMGSYQVMIIEDHSGNNQTNLTRWVEYYIEKEGLEKLVVERGGRQVVILGSNSSEMSNELAERLCKSAEARKYFLNVGISTLGSQSSRIHDLYTQALDALRIGSAIAHNHGGVWGYEKLGYISFLVDRPAEIRQDNHYYALIELLHAYDTQHDTDLLNTLEIHIEHLSSAKAASEALFTHRNTLYQRLQKISSLFKVDLGDILVLFNLYVAIKDWHIAHSIL